MYNPLKLFPTPVHSEVFLTYTLLAIFTQAYIPYSISTHFSSSLPYSIFSLFTLSSPPPHTYPTPPVPQHKPSIFLETLTHTNISRTAASFHTKPRHNPFFLFLLLLLSLPSLLLSSFLPLYCSCLSLIFFFFPPLLLSSSSSSYFLLFFIPSYSSSVQEEEPLLTVFHYCIVRRKVPEEAISKCNNAVHVLNCIYMNIIQIITTLGFNNATIYFIMQSVVTPKTLIEGRLVVTHCFSFSLLPYRVECP